MTETRLEISSLADTDRLGEALARAVLPGTTIALCGTLGAGKTRLVEAIAAAMGITRDDVVSPTFVLCQQYQGQIDGEPRTLYHFDAYRLADEDEFLALGAEEYFESEGIVLVEWADRIERCLPRDHLRVQIDVEGDEQRTVTVTGTGRKSREIVERLV